MTNQTIRIATRGSRLALWQSNHVRDLLLAKHPELRIELVTIVSTGDTVQDQPLVEIGSVGLFTKEVQDAVLDGRADLAVHSLKDLPTQTHPELELAAVPERAEPSDALISPKHGRVENLPLGATVATSSLRRRAQLLHRRSDLKVVDIRGNVETRLRKLDEESLDGVLLACAGLERLGLEDQITERLPHDLMLPAVGQGALGIECRRNDTVLIQLLSGLNHELTRQAVEGERMVMRLLEGGCHVPLAAHATVDEGTMRLAAVVCDVDGKRRFAAEEQGPASDCLMLGKSAADDLLKQGVRDVL